MHRFTRPLAGVLLTWCTFAGAGCSLESDDPWADWAEDRTAEPTPPQPRPDAPRPSSSAPLPAVGGEGRSAAAPDLPRTNDSSDAGTDSNTYATWRAALDDASSPILGFELPAPAPLDNATVRQVAHLSVGGDAIRIRLSNRHGKSPITFSKVHVAKSKTAGAIDPSTDRAVTFGGMTSVVLAPQAEAWSDVIDLPVTDLDDVAISIFVAGTADVTTEHRYAQRTNYVALGDTTTAADMGFLTQTISSSYWLSAIDVVRPTPASVVVAFGDSITDGNNSTSDANLRYPDQLSKLTLEGHPTGRAISIVNAGIGGNRWLHGGLGPAGSERFARDALEVTGVTDVVILMGINDIGFGVFSEAEAASLDSLTTAIADAVQQARAAGLRVFLGTLLPFGDCLYYTADGETLRQAVNTWIRESSDVDAVIDFERVIRDPADAVRYDARFDSGDHLHPNDAGYAAMAEEVRLAISR